MTGRGAPLTIDGQPFDRSRLSVLVTAAARDVDALGLGPAAGLTIPAGDPLGTVVGAAVAAATGVALVHSRLPLEALAHDPSACWARLWSTTAGDVVVEPCPAGLTPRPLAAEAGALLQTSGSSGLPRTVVLARNGLAYQVGATAERLGIDGDDELLLPLPLDHAYGFSVVELARATGARLHVETAPSARRVLRRLRTDRISALDGFPSLYRQLLALAKRDREVAALLASPRLRGCGGDVLAPSLASDFDDCVGEPLLDGYGLSEAGPNVALSSPELHRPGTAGPPLRGTDLRLASDGELLVRSPSVMLGYLDSGPSTAAAVDADGWLHTGDLAELADDGYVTVVGRKKHVIVVHGECHSPAKIEAAALAADVVAEAVAVGSPARHTSGDRITLFVQPASSRAVSGAVRVRVASACRALPVQLRPHSIVVLAELPKGTTGKPDRNALRRAAAAA